MDHVLATIPSIPRVREGTASVTVSPGVEALVTVHIDRAGVLSLMGPPPKVKALLIGAVHAIDNRPGITCGRCRAISHNPMDLLDGWCSACGAVTTTPEQPDAAAEVKDSGGGAEVLLAQLLLLAEALHHAVVRDGPSLLEDVRGELAVAQRSLHEAVTRAEGREPAFPPGGAET